MIENVNQFYKFYKWFGDMFTETQLKYEITRVYMDKNVPLAIDMCRNYINSHNGDVNDDFFQMLFAMYKTTNNKIQYIKLAKTYSELTGRIRKTWEEKEEIEVVSNKNLFISDGPLDIKSVDRLKEFYESSISKKFGRIDFNKLNIIKSSHIGLNTLLDVLKALRKSDAYITLMGDNKILNFNMAQFDALRLNSEKVIEERIAQEESQKKVQEILDANKKDSKDSKNTDEPKKVFLKSVFDKKELLNNTLLEISNIEKVVYLLKLEILQWKGYEKKHIELSIDYCNKFDVMPPEYHKDGEKIRRMSQSNNSSGVVSVEKMKNTINDVSTDVLVYKVNEVNTQNLDYLIDYLKGCNQFVITIDFKNVDYFTYEAGNTLLSFLQKFRVDDRNYIINFLNCNKMIQIIFEMFGLLQYVIVK